MGPAARRAGTSAMGDGDGASHSSVSAPDPRGPAAGRHLPDRGDDEMWSPMHGWLAARPGRAVTAAALVLIAFQALLRGYVTFSGWFVVDDFALSAWASRTARS